MASTSLLLNRAPTDAAEARALPANVEAEAAFLGALLIDNRILEDMQTLRVRRRTVGSAP